MGELNSRKRKWDVRGKTGPDFAHDLSALVTVLRTRSLYGTCCDTLRYITLRQQMNTSPCFKLQSSGHFAAVSSS
jgi:hypothetical protein